MGKLCNLSKTYSFAKSICALIVKSSIFITVSFLQLVQRGKKKKQHQKKPKPTKQKPKTNKTSKCCTASEETSRTGKMTLLKLPEHGEQQEPV